jgi:hypothetical protein
MGEEIKVRRLRFRLGRMVMTRNLQAQLSASDPEGWSNELALLIDRHGAGDWGELDQEDKDANERALAEGTRLLSAYTTSTGIKIWIITEWDRSYTTALLPDDY